MPSACRRPDAGCKPCRSDFDQNGGEQAELFRLEVTSYIAEGDMRHNPLLSDGDVIFVPQTGSALVLGQ